MNIDLRRPVVTTLATLALTARFVAIARADCPTATLQLGCPPPAQEIAGSDASDSTIDCNRDFATWYFRGSGDSLRFRYDGIGGGSFLTVRGRYRFLGAPAGTLIHDNALVHVAVSVSGYGGDPCDQTSAIISLLQDQAVDDSGQWFAQRGAGIDDNCHGTFSRTFILSCSHPAGTEFELARKVQLILAGGLSEHAELAAKTEFGTLPPGVFVVRCDGDTAQVVVLGVGPSVSSALRIDGVRPNPAPGEFRAALSAASSAPAHVRLLDVNGRVVESRVWYAVPGERHEISLGGVLAPGTYFLQLKQD